MTNDYGFLVNLVAYSLIGIFVTGLYLLAKAYDRKTKSNIKISEETKISISIIVAAIIIGVAIILL